jgi:hypothetical protein
MPPRAEYSVPLTTHNLPAIQAQAIEAAIKYEALQLPQHASQQRRSLFAFRAQLQRIAQEIASRAPEIIKDEELSSRVRPDTNGDGGPQLQDYLGVSHARPEVPGSVGVNHIPTLDASVPWWWTNELGYSGHIGRVVHGFFYDAGFSGRSRPDPSRFREHPLFRAEGPQSGKFLNAKEPPVKLSKGTRPGMLIKRPIPERRFVQKGGAKVRAEWHRRVLAAEDRFLAEIARISASAHAAVRARSRKPRPGGRRGRP